jgi:hypothetical protein
MQSDPVSFGTVNDFSADLAPSIHPEDGGDKFLRNFGKYTPKRHGVMSQKASIFSITFLNTLRTGDADLRF